MVYRGQAILLLVVAGLAAAVVGIVALSGSGITATLAARVSGMAVPASGIPTTISIASSPPVPVGSTQATAGPASPAAGGRPTASPGTGSTTLVPSAVYTYPADDHGHDGSPGGDGTSGDSGGHS